MKKEPAKWFATVLVGAVCAMPLCGCFHGSPVLNAAEEGDVEKVKSLLKQGLSVDERHPRIKNGWTPLIAAIYQRNVNVVHYLIESGADVNIPDNTGETAIMWATSGGDENLDLVKYLIAHGADLKAKDKGGATVLSYAGSLPPKPKLLEAVNVAMAQQGQTK